VRFHNGLMKYFLVIVLGIWSFTSFSQESIANPVVRNDSMNQILKQLAASSMPGNVSIVPHDERILDLLWKHVNYNDSIGIYGWKVLIYNGRSRTSAIEAESLFLNSFPDLKVPTKVVYPEPPDFKTLVGVYRTKEEAFKLMNRVKEVFKYCYLVYVRLEPGELD
jgi:hypothetical protein